MEVVFSECRPTIWNDVVMGPTLPLTVYHSLSQPLTTTLQNIKDLQASLSLSSGVIDSASPPVRSYVQQPQAWSSQRLRGREQFLRVHSGAVPLDTLPSVRRWEWGWGWGCGRAHNSSVKQNDTSIQWSSQRCSGLKVYPMVSESLQYFIAYFWIIIEVILKLPTCSNLLSLWKSRKNWYVIVLQKLQKNPQTKLKNLFFIIFHLFSSFFRSAKLGSVYNYFHLNDYSHIGYKFSPVFVFHICK
jgi:hypothetical protein